MAVIHRNQNLMDTLTPPPAAAPAPSAARAISLPCRTPSLPQAILAIGALPAKFQFISLPGKFDCQHFVKEIAGKQNLTVCFPAKLFTIQPIADAAIFKDQTNSVPAS